MNPSFPTDDELRDWAYAPDLKEPVQDWDLVLSWQMDCGRLRQCIQFADDLDCPKSPFFLEVLYLWVEGVAKGSDFAANRSMYDDWLNVAKGITDPAVKLWRHHARLILQGVEQFDRKSWWELAKTNPQVVDRQ